MILKPTINVYGRKVETAGCTQVQMDELLELGDQLGRNGVKALLYKFFGVTSRKDLTEEQAMAAIKLMRREIAALKRGGRSLVPALNASLGRRA